MNVCIVALDDALLKSTHAALRAEYPGVELRAVGVDLGCNPEAYTAKVASATGDVRVSMLFNNAGFLNLCFFEKGAIGRHAANVECNAMAAVRLTHHFYGRMVGEGVRGLVAFTSSAAWFMVCYERFLRAVCGVG